MSATWTMKSGQKINVSEMEHSHVVNCLNLMARRYPEYFSKFQTSVTKHTEKECKAALTKLLGMAKEINEERHAARINYCFARQLHDRLGQDSWQDIDWRD